MNDLLDQLNPPQREAVMHLGGPLMIIAGAGTGKTRVITHRIAFLAREVGIPLGQMLAVTFTNKAAREMRERVLRLLGMPESTVLPIGTFHSRCAMILRRESDAAGLDSNFAILDEKDQIQAIKAAMRALDVDDKRVKPGQVQEFINQAKMRMLTPDDTESAGDDDPRIPYSRLYRAYEAILTRNKSVDMEDLIFRAVRLFQDNPTVRRTWADRYRHVLVDEYQDTNHSQFLLTKLLAQDHRNICIVGDEDQAIYSWRGAEISNLLDFEKTFAGAKIVRLEQNYRSVATVLKAAGTVIARNTQRLGKTLWTELPAGDGIEFRRGEDDRHEGWLVAQEVARLVHAEGENPSEIAVFYRSHRLARAIEDAMRTFQVPYRIVGGVRFYDRAEIKDLLSFMRLAVNPDDDLAFERVANVPKRGVGDKALEDIRVAAGRKGKSRRAAAIDLVHEGGLSGRAKSGMMTFLHMIDQWEGLARTAPAHEVLARIIEDTAYETEGVGDPESIDGRSRIENIEEFKAAVAGHSSEGREPLTAEYLQAMALDTTRQEDTTTPTVSLMTVHNAKGLEFQHVFVVGLEDGVFPNSRAIADLDETGIEEERRLFYVALTRARRRLHLSRAARRSGWSGGFEMTQPSRFLIEMPPVVFDDASRALLRRDLPAGWDEEDGGPSARRRATGTGGLITTGARLFGRSEAGAGTGAPAAPVYRPGDRIVHRYMGPGEVVGLRGHAPSARIYIRFDDGTEQDFILRHAPLTREPKDLG